MSNTRIFLVLGLAALAAMTGLMMSQHHRSQFKPDLSLFKDLQGDKKLALRLVEFQEWTQEHGKQYSEHEKLRRFEIWNDNYDFVQEHNSQNHSYEVAINKFSDLTVEEFAALYLGFLGVPFEPDNGEDGDGETELESLSRPSKKIWVESVGPIRDQSTCGSCYAFASAATLESRYKIVKKQKSVVVLSPQQIVDCSKNYGNQGCSGGLMTYSYKYTKDSGIMSESSYKYQNSVGTCRYKSNAVVFKNKGHVEIKVPNTSNGPLLDAVVDGPVSIGIAAASKVFQQYSRGILDNTGCGTSLDHAVVITGYAKSGQTNYWKIKNSWGTGWGESGYIRIRRRTGNGVCGVNMMASYPTI